MNKLLIKGGLVVTVDAEDRVYRNGSIYIEDNIIKEVGPTPEVGDKEGAEVLDPDSTEPVSGPVSSGGDPFSAALALAFGLLGKGAVIGGIPVGSLRLNLGPISEYAPILRVFRGDPERDFDVQEVGRLANVGKKAYDYLRDLSKFGFLDVGLKRGPSSGRPRNLYRLTDFGRVLSRLL